MPRTPINRPLRLRRPEGTRIARGTDQQPASSPAQPPRTPIVDIGDEAGRAQLVNILCDYVDTELGARANLEQDWCRWLQKYKANDLPPKTYPWPGASNCNINLTAIYVDTLVAKIMQSVFAANPLWVARPYNAKYELAAEPLERYLDWLRENAWNEYHIVKPMVLELCKLGTGVLTNGWSDLPIVRTDERTGNLITLGRRTGPRPAWVRLEDFLIPRGFNAINESEKGVRAPWVAYRQRMTKADLQRLAYTEFFTDIEPVLKARGDDPTTLDLERQRQGDLSPQAGSTDENDLWAIWQIWCTWDLNNDRYPEDYVATIHPASKTLLRLRPNPYLDGMRPFVACPFIEQEGEFYGIGVSEMVESYEAEVTTMHNQRIDNAHIANTVVLAARRGSGITDKVELKPGKILLLTDPNDVREIRFGANYMADIQQEQVTISMAERRVGISDLNLGRESSPLGRAAATTVMQLLQEGSRRHDLQTSDLRRALSEQAIQLVELFQTHGVPEPDAPGSPEQVLDPEGAIAVRTMLSSAEPISGIVGLQLNAATQAVNKEVERQANQEMFTVLTTQYYQPILNILPQISNPQAPPFVRQIVLQMVRGADEFLKRILNSRQVYDVDKLLLSDDLEKIMAQIDMMAAQQPPGVMPPGGPPPGRPGPGGPPLGPNGQAGPPMMPPIPNA